jgi:hypothetical protein
MKSSGTVIYITKLEAKCNRMGWPVGTQQITKFTNDSGSMINIISEYGQISMATLQMGCEDFLKAVGAQCNQRASQNNEMMAQCILRTLSASAWTFGTKFEHNNVAYAPLLHKKVMALATIDSVATTKTLRSNLREIVTYCTTIKGDINLLHSYFNNNYSQIIDQGATVDNPVDILFTAYSVVPCAHFCLYIKGKRDGYTNGTAIYTHEQLILLASNKYNLLVQEGIFGAKLLEEEKIIAMQAELMALKGQFVLAPSLQKRKTMSRRISQRVKRKRKRILRTRRSRSEWRNGNVCLPRTVSCTKRSTTIGPTTGAPTTWYGAIILPRTVEWAKTARRSRTRDATHMQLQLLPPPLANLSGLISLQTCTAT